MSRSHSIRFGSRFETFPPAAAIVIAVLLLAATAGVAAARSAGGGEAVPLRLPPDRVYAETVPPDSAVTFRHSTHVGFESNRCTGCHPKRYRILGPSPRPDHRDMDRGGSCGACHDGKRAFDVRDRESCGSCHAGRPAPAEPGVVGAPADPRVRSGPPPFVYRRGSASPGMVTFRHETHRAGMKCSSCHPRHFPMKAVPQDPNTDWHERERCGGCHDGKRSFGVEDDASCGRCHVEGKAGR